MGYLILFFLFSNFLHSAEVIYLNKFDGLNTYLDSSQIANSEASDLQNVITDRGRLEKRNGITTFLDTGKSKILKVFEYISANNLRYLIYISSGEINVTDFNSTNLISNINTDYPISYVKAWNKVFFSNKFEDSFYWSPSEGKVVLNDFPHCKILEFADERLYCANNLENGESSVMVSEYGNYENWNLPTDRNLIATDPFLTYFDNNDGDEILCFKNTPYGKLVGKKNKIFIMKGDNINNYYQYQLSDNIGCISQESIQINNGLVLWLGNDGIYGWDGRSYPQLISKEIYDNIKNNQHKNFSQNSITYRTKNVFDTGNYVSGDLTQKTTWYNGAVRNYTYEVNLDSTYFKNNGTKNNLVYSDINKGIQTAPYVLLDDFSDGEYHFNPTWYQVILKTGGSCVNGGYSVDANLRLKHIRPEDCSGYVGYIYTSSATTSYGRWKLYIDGNFNVDNTNGIQFFFVSSSNDINNTQGYFISFQDGGISLYKRNVNTDVFIENYLGLVTAGEYEIERTTEGFYVRKDTQTLLVGYADNSYTTSNYYIIRGYSSNLNSAVYVDDIKYSPYYSTGTYITDAIDTGIPEAKGKKFLVSEILPEGTTAYYYFSQSYDGINWDSYQEVKNNGDIDITKQYIKFKVVLNTKNGDIIPIIDNIQTEVRYKRGYYSSNVEYIPGNISKWLTFYANDYAGEGNQITYFIRGSNIGFTPDDVEPPNWIQINKNSLISLPTDYHYIQFKATTTLNTTDDLYIKTVSINWQEGENIPTSSIVYDNRYMICIATSPLVSYDDVCYMLQRNAKWTKFTGWQLLSLGRFNNQILGGDYNNGKIYNMFVNDVYSDDGNPIEAYWITGNLNLNFPYFNKILKEVWIEGVPNEAVITVGYSKNRESNFTEKTINLNEFGNYFIKRVPNLPDGYANGRYFKFKIYDNSTLNFNINSVIILYDVDKSLRPY